MAKNWITGLVLCGLVVGGFLLLANGRAGKSVNGGELSTKLTASETSFDFGRISMAAGKVQHSFIVKNNSDTAIKVRQITTSCMCTIAMWRQGDKTLGPFGMSGHGGPTGMMEDVLTPGAEAEVVVEFDPAAHGPAGVGVIERQVSITADDGETVLGFRAEVEP